jgi:uncharacterized protein (UPF0210 family)
MLWSGHWEGKRMSMSMGMGVTIRTITLGIADAHPLDAAALEQAAMFLQAARGAAEAAGYVVQTTRIATRPLLEDLAGEADAAVEEYAGWLQRMCQANRIDFCSIGPAPADDLTFPPERIALLPRILAPNAALSATVQLASLTHGVRFAAALPTALAMRELAQSDAGAANFRFAALACCEPGGPFFPQAYARGERWSVAVGLQSAGLVRRTIKQLAERVGPGMATLAGMEAAVTPALTAAAEPVVALVKQLASEAASAFGGIDLSPAPLGDESIADAIEAVGLGRFGEPGTLAVAAALTAALKRTPLPLCGYNGLMLPVLEDRTIGERCAQGDISVAALLAYSAVCGTGLDTVPIPGDTPPEHVAALLVDVASLAARLRKPLSARLFLVPGGAAGAMTHFASPYLINTRIMPV